MNCPGLLLGPACTPLLALGRVLAFSATFLANALACGGVGSREQKEVREAHTTQSLAIRQERRLLLAAGRLDAVLGAFRIVV